eukprot:TRINITY_DN7548_c0_g2_i1.p2 TRINITY_DN7548_c0_g2~~TRINITY_DN7548_c0_g2_i1.p2  ORF type:complete len:115 (+),score=17.65 TRINITY_DN7548_c0_g2_i1:578-922(+)
MRNTKKEIAKVTARMSSRILTMAQTVLNAKKAEEMVKTKLNSELSFRALETEYKAWAFWSDATSCMTGWGLQYLLFTTTALALPIAGTLPIDLLFVFLVLGSNELETFHVEFIL